MKESNEFIIYVNTLSDLRINPLMNRINVVSIKYLYMAIVVFSTFQRIILVDLIVWLPQKENLFATSVSNFKKMLAFKSILKYVYDTLLSMNFEIPMPAGLQEKAPVISKFFEDEATLMTDLD